MLEKKKREPVSGGVPANEQDWKAQQDQQGGPNVANVHFGRFSQLNLIF
jgi:hypothetical protein